MAMLLLVVLVARFATSQGIITEAIILRRHCRPNCLSWRVANEANNTIGWTKFPTGCIDYVKDYLVGNHSQYRDDSQLVIDQAIDYLKNLSLPKDGTNDIWVFDIDDTVLSNVQYFIDIISGSESWNSILPANWVFTVPELAQDLAPALPESKRLYDEVLRLGVKVVFLTGRSEENRNVTVVNLVADGFGTWEKLILKSDEFQNSTTLEYKSTMRTRLEEQGYIIVGNIGDQWSDITGPSPGRRTFKLPNPMYYIA
ncbi:hypothetical protein JCGZ_24844 [Jatropha curcas]|uniref:Acid phosphatase n=2 Tax=Jatropha curcas TaxID=180498 RepID=A0A067L8M2_JATCU|nr:hypothetical protein JCGZ_24844 [Jatropha curcas]